MKTAYFDNASTTKVYDEVVELMNKYQKENYGNPSSPHSLGEKSINAINDARKKIAAELGCKPHEIIFTSGATESNNIALKGFVKKNNVKRIFISSIEHSSVYEVALELKKEGIDVVEVHVDANGMIDIDFLYRNLQSGDLVSVIHGQSKIGVIQDIFRIGKICKAKNAYFHTDAAQSFGKTSIKVNEMHIDILSASAHKIHGPKGVGILFVKNGIEINPIMQGGNQERKIRPGTENVAGIIGFGKAVEKIQKVDRKKIAKLRDYLMKEIESIGGRVNGDREKRLYNNVNAYFHGLIADEAIIKLSVKGIMCSARSACLTKQKNDNRVLKAIGLSEDESAGSIRFVLSEFNKKSEIDYLIKEMKKLL